MAIVAKMNAQRVEKSGGGRWVACAEDDEGAEVAEGHVATSSYTDPPQWLMTTGFIRHEPNAQAGEGITLSCVAQPKGADPDRTNAHWANASPSGQLTMYIANPGAFDYVKAGKEYRVTIEEVRGPRS